MSRCYTGTALQDVLTGWQHRSCAEPGDQHNSSGGAHRETGEVTATNDVDH